MHVAGPVEHDELEGDVQRCLLCDAVVSAAGQPPVEVGEHVVLDGDGGCSGRIDALAPQPV